MRGQAFCPAHVTGFFKAHMDGRGPGRTGSLGAGFSIQDGVTTTVTLKEGRRGPGYEIRTEGFGADNTRVSEFVAERFLQLGGAGDVTADILHEIAVPVGYGLGCSGAVALSLAYAMDRALGTGLRREEIGAIAHEAEVGCSTGLGDVLASYHGGFEIRTEPGAPGIGRVTKLGACPESVVMICFAPVSTRDFLRDRLPQINGLGGRMVERLARTGDAGHFQDMSLEFARYVDVMTPRMQAVVDDLRAAGIRCGVALFGETVFSLVDRAGAEKAREIAARHEGATVISSAIDRRGARVTG